MYTVKNLAKFSGISVRTLHFYDEIGLLKPAFYGDNKYRYYKQEQLLILQQILFFREFGFPLDEIKKIIGSNDFDKVEALKTHKYTLEHDLNRIKKLIKTINTTIDYLRGNVKIEAAEFFKGFDPEKKAEYENYLVKSGKVAQTDLDSIWIKFQNLKDSDKTKFKLEGEMLNKDLTTAMEKSFKPTSPEVQILVKRHYDWIKNFWSPNKDAYISIAMMYCEHDDFKRFFDTYHAGLADFFSKAMKIFAERELS